MKKKGTRRGVLQKQLKVKSLWALQLTTHRLCLHLTNKLKLCPPNEKLKKCFPSKSPQIITCVYFLNCETRAGQTLQTRENKGGEREEKN